MSDAVAPVRALGTMTTDELINHRINYVAGPHHQPRVLLGQSRASDELAAIALFLILALMWPFYIATPLTPDFKILIKWAIKRLRLRTAPNPMSMATRRLDTCETDCRESDLQMPTAKNICQGNRRITTLDNIIMVTDRRSTDNNVPGQLLKTINPPDIRYFSLREGTLLKVRPSPQWRTHHPQVHLGLKSDLITVGPH